MRFRMLTTRKPTILYPPQTPVIATRDLSRGPASMKRGQHLIVLKHTLTYMLVLNTDSGRVMSLRPREFSFVNSNLGSMNIIELKTRF